MFIATMAAVLFTMLLALARAVLGPTVYDRILGVNMAGTKTVLLIAVLGFLSGRPEFLGEPTHLRLRYLQHVRPAHQPADAAHGER